MMKPMMPSFQLCIVLLSLGQAELCLGSHVEEDQVEIMSDLMVHDDESDVGRKPKKRRSRSQLTDTSKRSKYWELMRSTFFVGIGSLLGYTLGRSTERGGQVGMYGVEMQKEEKSEDFQGGRNMQRHSQRMGWAQQNRPDLVALGMKGSSMLGMSGTPKGSDPREIHSCGGRYCFYGYCLHNSP